ncbi:NLR family CARD domain-containing protein 3-like [Chanos chanos]|uniref:NLR family CARD domain-containing protein 3-like n=1 Tax=Chanos chanos TaxID=29144 RepID=A0A6J2VSX2_CHACN|nr:NLR family CARD domain-containing protein 3-like [Chanos chanos]
MSQVNDGEQGTPVTQSRLSGKREQCEGECLSKLSLNSHHTDRADTASCVSMRSDGSMGFPINFRDGDCPAGPRFESAWTATEIHNLRWASLKRKFQYVCEGTAKQQDPTVLNEIYTELYIIKGGSGKVNNEHEVRQIENSSWRPATLETTIKCNDIFKQSARQDKPVRTVLTKGVAGIGKTVSVQKFILDWAEGRANQDLIFIFPLPFRELNLMKEKNLSFMNLLNIFFPETKDFKFSKTDEHKILFIFDGLDECRLPLDFQNSEVLCDVTQPAPVDVLLTNLITGNLLPSALLWITSRPAAANQIPNQFVDEVTEIRGFSDLQREEYFRKRMSDHALSSRVISHVKSIRSLYIMCHIPVFCWISATVLGRMLNEPGSGEVPNTLTQMYTHFLIIQTCIRGKKYNERVKSNEDLILKLGKLAYKQLEKGNLIFYEEDLRECGIDITEASVYSGVCSQIFREEFGLNQGKVFCFVHFSIQEHLAAMYVFLSFSIHSTNVLNPAVNTTMANDIFSGLHKSAVDMALQSDNGHWDLFLRFLLGLSVESNQTLLGNLLTQTTRRWRGKEKTVKYIKDKVPANPDRSINLFHCLNELNDHSLVAEIKSYLKSGTLSKTQLTPEKCLALVFVLLTCDEELDVFDMSRYVRSDACLLRLLPVVKVCRTALLLGCKLTHSSCTMLASALSSNSSSLRELDLSHNNLQDTGVKSLCACLVNPQGKLQVLSLNFCGVADQGFVSLATALSENLSHLKELHLMGNIPGDLGMKLLSALLEDTESSLEKLQYCE